MQIGFWQIVIIVLLVVIFFGRGKISQLMGDVAEGIKKFKKGMSSEETLDSKEDKSKDSNSKSEK
ncbi:MAG: twin-arginine translocase TatA/TatE family subunit [Pelagibacterales bacterium]|nr:twin-arginine translocase TatA/TatE family subunit [Pelagibacterales bacterium]